VARTVAREEASSSGVKRPGILPWVILIVVAIVALWPMYWLYITAFTPTQDTVKTPPDLIPIHASLTNFSRLFHQAKDYWHWALNSLIISLSVTAFHLLFDTMAGYAFAKKRFPGRNFFFWLILSTLMIPSHVTLVPLYIVARHLHLINNILAVILPGTADVFGIFLMRQFFMSFPMELEEAARVDGLSVFGIYWRIALPLAKPALATLGIVQFQGNWDSFLMPSFIASTENMYTLPVGLANYSFTYLTYWPQLMAGSMIVILPILVLYIFLQRYFIEGIARSGVKG